MGSWAIWGGRVQKKSTSAESKTTARPTGNAKLVVPRNLDRDNGVRREIWVRGEERCGWCEGGARTEHWGPAASSSAPSTMSWERNPSSLMLSAALA